VKLTAFSGVNSRRSRYEVQNLSGRISVTKSEKMAIRCDSVPSAVIRASVGWRYVNSFPVLRYTSWMGHCTMETKYASGEFPDKLAAWLDSKLLALAEPKFSLLCS
jgi:hypothetical protein